MYNSLYRADDQLFVKRHAYGIPAAHSSVFCHLESGEIASAYAEFFERVWLSARSTQ